MSLLSSLPEREEKEKRATSGLRNCVLYLSIFSPVSKSVFFLCSFVVFALFLFVWWHQRGSDLTSHLVSVSVLLFGSCHLILFVSSTNSIQIVRRQCCLTQSVGLCFPGRCTGRGRPRRRKIVEKDLYRCFLQNNH